MSLNTILYIGFGLLLVIFTALYQYKKLEIENLNLLVAKLEANNSQSEILITKQNEAINEIAIDKELAMTKLEEWRAKPPKIRYEVIYKDREVIKSNECDDIKSRLDDVRTRDFNSL